MTTCDDCEDSPASIRATAGGPEGMVAMFFCFGCAQRRDLDRETKGVEAL